MNTRLALVVAPLLAACTVVESRLLPLPADGLRRVEASLDRGDFVYLQPHRVQVRGSAWGRASAAVLGPSGRCWFRPSARVGCGRRLGAASSGAGAASPLGVCHGRHVRRSGTGGIELNGVRGHIVAAADRVRVVDAVGSADLYADGQRDWRPGARSGDVIRIEAEGDIDLALPWGLAYDLGSG